MKEIPIQQEYQAEDIKQTSASLIWKVLAWAVAFVAIPIGIFFFQRDVVDIQYNF